MMKLVSLNALSLRAPHVAGWLATALLAFAPAAHAAEQIKVVTSVSNLIFAPVYVAQQLGYFKHEGLDVTIADGNGGSNAVASVVGSSADIGIVGIKNASQAVVKGQPLKAFATGVQGFPQAIVARTNLPGLSALSGQATLTDKGALLRAKTIAVTDIGGSTGEFARFVLKTAQVADNDIKLVNIPTVAAQLAALKAGRIDAFVNSSPAIEQATTEGYGVKLVDPALDLKDQTDFEYTVQVARADVLNQRGEAIGKYLRAVQRALDLIHSDKDKARDAVFTYFADSAEITQAFPTAIRNQAWDNTVPYLPRSVKLDDAKLAKAREFFQISDKATDELFIDRRAAQAVPAAKATR